MRTFAAALLLLNCVHLLFAFLSARDMGFSTFQIYSFTAPRLATLIITVVIFAVSTFKNPPTVWLSGITAALLVGTLFTARRLAPANQLRKRADVARHHVVKGKRARLAS